MEDIVRGFGHLTLGSRLRRLGEQLQADTQRIIDAAGADIQASQYPCLAALDRHGPLTVGELAAALGITQPGVTRTAALLVEAGYLAVQRDPGDQRVRRLALTPKGTALVARSKAEIWPRIEAAVADLCAPLAGSLLDQLAGLEAGLAERPLHRRAAAFAEVAP